MDPRAVEGNLLVGGVSIDAEFQMDPRAVEGPNSVGDIDNLLSVSDGPSCG